MRDTREPLGVGGREGATRRNLWGVCRLAAASSVVGAGVDAAWTATQLGPRGNFFRRSRRVRADFAGGLAGASQTPMSGEIWPPLPRRAGVLGVPAETSSTLNVNPQRWPTPNHLVEIPGSGRTERLRDHKLLEPLPKPLIGVGVRGAVPNPGLGLPGLLVELARGAYQPFGEGLGRSGRKRGLLGRCGRLPNPDASGPCTVSCRRANEVVSSTPEQKERNQNRWLFCDALGYRADRGTELVGSQVRFRAGERVKLEPA